jgi:transposase
VQVATEAGGSAHHWARVPGKPGHQVAFLPAARVRPFVRSNKDEAADARAFWLAAQQSDRWLRALFSHGAREVIEDAKDQPKWTQQMLAIRPPNVVVVALANKMARIAWALLTKGGSFRNPVVAA